MITQQRIAIIGGGYTGCVAAIHLARLSPEPLSITVFEPRAAVGQGQAYGTTDPDHRLNVPIDNIRIFADDPDHVLKWYAARGYDDKDGREPDGRLFCRRGIVGRYFQELFDDAAARNASGSQLRHCRAKVDDAAAFEGGFRLTFEGRVAAFDQVLVCIGQAAARLPAALSAVAGRAGVVADPWDTDAVARLASDRPVLLVGAGLTGADVIMTLLRNGHSGLIHVISRSGLRPLPHPVSGPAKILRGGDLSEAAVIRRHGVPKTLRAMLRLLRKDIAEGARAGEDWYKAFDEMREAIPIYWRALSDADRRRAMRHLRSVYNVHRFRIAPPILKAVAAAEAAGQVRFERAVPISAADAGDEVTVRLRRADGTESDLRFAGVVNCTGPNANVETSRDGLIRALCRRGLATPDPSGVGFAIDDMCASVGADGRPIERLRILGPPTQGHFGDLTGIMDINIQVTRVVQQMLAAPAEPRLAPVAGA